MRRAGGARRTLAARHGTVDKCSNLVASLHRVRPDRSARRANRVLHTTPKSQPQNSGQPVCIAEQKHDTPPAKQQHSPHFERHHE